jgi:hypothetical protein
LIFAQRLISSCRHVLFLYDGPLASKIHSWHFTGPCMQLESMIELINMSFSCKLHLSKTFSSLVHLFTNLRLDSRDSQPIRRCQSWWTAQNPINTHRVRFAHTRNVPVFGSTPMNARSKGTVDHSSSSFGAQFGTRTDQYVAPPLFDTLSQLWR